MLKDVPANGEYRPVIDLQNIRPGRQGLSLWVWNIRSAYHAQWLYGVVRHPSDALVEDQRVGKDGTRHAARLWNVYHSEQACGLYRDPWVSIVQFVQYGRDPIDASLERIGGGIHCLLGHRH